MRQSVTQAVGILHMACERRGKRPERIRGSHGGRLIDDQFEQAGHMLLCRKHIIDGEK